MARIPPWIRLKMRTDGDFGQVSNLVSDLSLHTVCQSAKCPNIHECWGRGTGTLMILGNICTRDCGFCAIPAGRPEALQLDEPERVAQAAKRMKLRHIVLTSVTRDDLNDGGSTLFAETIEAVRRELPGISIEVLTPDFEAKPESIERVLATQPDVFSHNLETVRRFQPIVRPQATYGRSLAVLQHAANWTPSLVIKSGLMLGFGETEEELFEAMHDLLDAGVRLLTLGQYLQPSRHHTRVVRYVTPEEFDAYGEKAKALGFHGVASGPMVRSSYKADELLETARGFALAAS